MALPPAPIFDLSTRRVVEVDRYTARHLLSEHRAGAVHPVPGDILPLLWWALTPDPGAGMPTLRGPPIYFRPGPLCGARC
jgi:hypothetical protein